MEEEGIIMGSTDRYREEMKKHLPVKDDDELLKYHKLTVQGLMGNVDMEAIGDAFIDIIDLNWEKCEAICRETLDRLENGLSTSTEDYWSKMRKLSNVYTANVGKSLSSKMPFIRLEYLERRQDKDFDILKEAIEDDATAGTVETFKQQLKLQTTYGRVFVYWHRWINCRKETIGIFDKILEILRGEVPANGTNPVKLFLEKLQSRDEFDKFLIQFAHLVNKDLSCYKALITRLAEFLKLIKSREYLEAFDVGPKILFFNISTFQTNVSVRQSDMCSGYDLCEKVICRENKGLGVTNKLLACTSRPLLHLKDLLRKLSDEDRLDQAGIEGVINDLQEEETEMFTMFPDSQLSFLDVACKVNAAVEQLRGKIQVFLPKREKTIATIKQIIEKLYTTRRTAALSVGFFGALIGGVILAPFTFGASLAPAIVGGVTLATGAAVAVIVIDKGEMERATTCIKEDKDCFEEVANGIENLRRNSNLLLRCVPQDELEFVISVFTNPQSTERFDISSESQADAQIANSVAKLLGINRRPLAISISGLVLASTIASSKAISDTLTLNIVGLALNMFMFGLADRAGARSENAEGLEKVVIRMEKEKVIMKECIAENELGLVGNFQT